MGDLVMFQQMGFGVAVALLIDATIIRSVLVPATMTLLGALELVPAQLAGVVAQPARRRGVAHGKPLTRPKRLARSRRQRAGKTEGRSPGPQSSVNRLYWQRRFRPSRDGGALSEPPTLARRFPSGHGDTPLPAGTSTARTVITQTDHLLSAVPSAYASAADGRNGLGGLAERCSSRHCFARPSKALAP